MLHRIKQTNPRFLKDIQKYGCLFLCFAQASPMIFSGDIGILTLNELWKKCIREGIISGDLNGDGDCDDAGEAEVKNHNALAQTFALSVHYDGKWHDPSEKIPNNVNVIFGCYFWKGTHFVVLNRDLTLAFDPFGKSNTVKNGYLKNVRWYYAD